MVWIIVTCWLPGAGNTDAVASTGAGRVGLSGIGLESCSARPRSCNSTPHYSQVDIMGQRMCHLIAIYWQCDLLSCFTCSNLQRASSMCCTVTVFPLPEAEPSIAHILTFCQHVQSKIVTCWLPRGVGTKDVASTRAGWVGLFGVGFAGCSVRL